MRLLIILLFISVGSYAQPFKFFDGSLKEGQFAVFYDIYFEFNSPNLYDTNQVELDVITDFLLEHKNIQVEIGVHTSFRGSDAYNLKMSNKRAEVLKAYFVSKGIKEKRAVFIGFGESKPVIEYEDWRNFKDTHACGYYTKGNRRITVVITKSYGVLAQNEVKVYKEFKEKSKEVESVVILNEDGTFSKNFHKKNCSHCALHTYTGDWEIEKDTLSLVLDEETKKVWSIKGERVYKYQIKKKELIRIIIDDKKEKAETPYDLIVDTVGLEDFKFIGRTTDSTGHVGVATYYKILDLNGFTLNGYTEPNGDFEVVLKKGMSYSFVFEVDYYLNSRLRVNNKEKNKVIEKIIMMPIKSHGCIQGKD